jgi:hypothetical protein
MSTVALQSSLMEQLEQVASEQDLMPDELLETALQAYLQKLAREKIKAEALAFQTMHPELVKDYLGQYVAMHKGKVVDHDPDFQALHRRVRQRFGRQAILLRRVEATPEHEMVFRSPRFQRDQP